MNYGLAKEIYGLTPWCVDSVSFHSLNSILKNIQSGNDLEIPELKYNTPFVLQIKNDTRIIQYDWQLQNSDSFEGIGVININGAIVKNSGASTVGMNELAKSMLTMSKDKRIKGFVLQIDSGGGSSAAVQIMVDAINEVKKTKPVYAVIEKGGMMASAAYGIGSASNKIFAEDLMSIVGSVGTMIQFEAKPNGNVDANGEKTIVLYATKSTEKNKAFEEAVNNDNYKLLINDLLDPINENFISMVQDNRPQLKGSNFDNGHTVFAKDAIGTFIDGIASFDEVVNMVISDSKNYKQIESKLNNNKKKNMTKQEFLHEHPTVYAEIVAEGVKQEKERVSSWLVHKDTDFEAVSQGIASGEVITPTQTQEFLVKMTQKGMIHDLKNGSAKPITTPTSQTESPKDENVNKELEEAFNFEI